MTIYISQGRYTAAAIKGMTAKPEDRSEAVAELFAAAGARLISWYLTLGPYDWLIIAEAPDEPTMISAVLAAAAGGSLSDITTTVALTASDTTKAFPAGRRAYSEIQIGGPCRLLRSRDRFGP